MLEKIESLKQSIREEQFEEVQTVLGPELYELFVEALSSEEEDEAKDCVKRFSQALTRHPLKAFKLYGRMDSQQKKIIQDLMEN